LDSFLISRLQIKKLEGNITFLLVKKYFASAFEDRRESMDVDMNLRHPHGALI
jgi:hypothetical protein